MLYGSGQVEIQEGGRCGGHGTEHPYFSEIDMRTATETPDIFLRPGRRMVITRCHLFGEMRDMFRKLGRRTEQFKQEMDAGAAENADYEWQECKAQFAVKPDQCPNCGSEEILPRKDEEESI